MIERSNICMPERSEHENKVKLQCKSSRLSWNYWRCSWSVGVVASWILIYRTTCGLHRNRVAYLFFACAETIYTRLHVIDEAITGSTIRKYWSFRLWSLNTLEIVEGATGQLDCSQKWCQFIGAGLWFQSMSNMSFIACDCMVFIGCVFFSIWATAYLCHPRYSDFVQIQLHLQRTK